jgi:hypothetical protein
MKLDLEPLKKILNDLKHQINLEKQRTLFDPKKIEAYCWIFGSPDYVFLQGNIYKTLPPESPAGNENALVHYKAWLNHALGASQHPIINEATKSLPDKDLTLEDIDPQIIPAPTDGESLAMYLIRMHKRIYHNHGWKQNEEISLKSFVNFLKGQPATAGSFLDVLFPSGMEFFKNAGIVSISPQPKYCLDFFEASKILQTLADMLFEKRPNAQFLIAQALGLCWMCLTKARISHPSYVKIIHQTSINTLYEEDTKKCDILEEVNPGFFIPTLRGKFHVPISKHLHEYLSRLAALHPRSKTILQSSPRALRHSFASALKGMPGNISQSTFQSFLDFDYEEICLQEFSNLSH